MNLSPRPCLQLLTLALLACDAADPPAEDAGAEHDEQHGADACTAEVRIGVFASDACAGEPLLVQTLELAEPCSTWNHGERENSATRYQCWRDRLCFTQYVDSATCDPDAAVLVTDKEARTTCEKDPTPKIYTKILSGTEGCPEPPPGFTCPLSDHDGGTPGTAAACEE
jgi:hypothetical protein